MTAPKWLLLTTALSLLMSCQPNLGHSPLPRAAAGSTQRPGSQPDGSVLLPNNWSLTPAGTQIPVGDLPLGLALSPDGRYLLVSNNGYADQYVSVIDVEARKEVQRLPMERAWLGIAFNDRGDRIYVSAGGADEIEAFAFEAGRARSLGAIAVKAVGDKTPYFVSGLAVAGDLLLACQLRANKLAIVDLAHDNALTYVDVGSYPYTVVHHADRAFVSNWGSRSVSLVDLQSRRSIAQIDVGSHPNAMTVSRDGRRLYVTNANSNELSILDVETRAVSATLDLSPYPGAPLSGSTPNGLALTQDGRTLFIANADNNSVTVVDVSSTPARVQGMIPTAWYPTAVHLAGNDSLLLVANGKGMSSKANPKGPAPGMPETTPIEYIGQLFLGTVSVVDVPDAAALRAFTSQVRRNNGFDAIAERLRAGQADVPARAIPRHLGEPSSIEHVFYIIKENRTYDQILGDLPQGAGDPALTLFGREITPNHHALAESFVLFDNFYVDAEVSQDGHSWSMGAIATDFVEKLWPTSYSDRNFPTPLPIFDMSYPHAGFIWDAAGRAGVTYRSYGEFVRPGPAGFEGVGALKDHVCPRYPGTDLVRYSDVQRAEIFSEEFERFVAAGTVPRLNIIQLPGDHTVGTRPNLPTPRAKVADNDLALGRIVEAISKSSIWAKSVIFVIEDDSQNGADHIDAHRSVALVASPYAKRGFVDHTMYDTVSILRTIELILGLPPMSQYDAAAVPLHLAFSDAPDVRPYTALPNRVPLDELNRPESPGAALSLAMNFSELDAAPELLLNQIIWKSIKGADSEMPTPHTNRDWVDEEEEEEEEEESRRDL